MAITCKMVKFENW